LIFDYRGTFRLAVPASGGKQDACAPPEPDFAKVKSASVAIGNRTV
jgi:hypothetical protein